MSDEDPDFHRPYEPEQCASCAELTPLRCGCGLAVCHLCSCPDRCDEDGPEMPPHGGEPKRMSDAT